LQTNPDLCIDNLILVASSRPKKEMTSFGKRLNAQI
jgi:hypothetical protein